MIELSTLMVAVGTLALSSFAVFWARSLRIPHTVLLVALGVGIGLLSTVQGFGFLESFHLTPEVLFYIFLPILIFESAYNISVRKLAENSLPITLLAIVSLLISTLAVGFGLQWALSFVGIELPLMIALLFGALISATDPVAVLALFKEFGAPRRLALVFEGESLFNDATGVALFLVMLEIVLVGFNGVDTVTAGFITFSLMIVNGIIFGVLCGVVFAKAIQWTRANEQASIALTFVLAYCTFLGADLLTHYLYIGEQKMYVSAIIATTIASIIMGNYGRPKIHPKAEEFVDKLWGQLAFIVNSVVFILVGILFVDIPFASGEVLIPILLSIVVVALGRALSIYPVVSFYNLFANAKQHIPLNWQHLLSWGSLRGALAVTLVLMIPEDLAIAGWTLETSPREFILALTIGCIFFTIFVKATTIQALMGYLKLNTMTDEERVAYQEACALTHREVSERLHAFHERGYITEATFKKLLSDHAEEYKKACATLKEAAAQSNTDYTSRVLRVYAIGIETKALKELYQFGEVSEATFKRIMGKLTVQQDDIEHGILDATAVSVDGRDVFERAIARAASLFKTRSAEEVAAEQYSYYRAQSIISRKVLKEMGKVNPEDAASIFSTDSMNHVIGIYTQFREGSQKKMEAIEREHPTLTEKLGETFAMRGVAKVEEHVLEELYERRFITPKLFVTLKEKFHVE
ncbi:sodium:proton antiporter [Patescibacteria group bacterium]|nr:sodium:proton antiporter [Patescibacteria group bacterium]